MYADRNIRLALWGTAVITAVGLILSGEPVSAVLSDQDIAALSKLGEAQGRSPDDMKRLIEQARRADALGLPSESLLDKIKEGLAKGIDSNRIEQRLATMSSHMETADALLKETGTGRGQITPQERGRALVVLSEALGRGVRPDEVQSMNRALGDGGRGLRADTLAYDAKALALMKEGGLPVDESLALVAAATRRGADQTTLLDLARELKSRGPEYRDNRARLQDLRNAVERGESLEKILDDARSRSDRPRLEHGRKDLSRPDRPERPAHPERPERPERPIRPHR